VHRGGGAVTHERDASACYVSGGTAGDTIRAKPGSTFGWHRDGHLGDGRVEGADGPDLIYAFAGVDTVAAGGGNDNVSADENDTGFGDVIGCGTGDDTADLDANDVSAGCETRR
jgi:hypothetical protein